jgi:hypothetical protein
MRTRLSGGGIHAPQHVEPIDRLDAAERGGGLARFVGLQMADEVPLEIEIPQLVDLRERFLDLVLAEQTLAGGGRLADAIGAEGLRDGDELDLRRVAPGACGGGADALPHRLQVCGDVAHGRLRTPSRRAT